MTRIVLTATMLVWLPAFVLGQQSQTAQQQPGETCNEGQANTGNAQGMSNPATQAVHGQQRQLSGQNRGRIRPTAGSAGAGMSPTAEPARAAQRGRGMHDSTTSRPGDTTTQRPLPFVLVTGRPSRRDVRW